MAGSLAEHFGYEINDPLLEDGSALYMYWCIGVYIVQYYNRIKLVYII